MVIAIDYDKTFDKDLELWACFISYAHKQGHQCLVVTCRMNTQHNKAIIESALSSVDCNVPIIFTNLEAKQPIVSAVGYSVDVWIDDDPDSITYGKPVDRVTSRKRAKADFAWRRRQRRGGV